MCRLVLMNAAAATLFTPDELARFFQELENAQGGDGNGIAALWPERANVRMSKGLKLTAPAAARKVKAAVAQKAEWVLYHTRLATAGSKISRNCHPFQHGKLLLAHNGHDFERARLGHSIGVTDSECLALLWSRLHLPLDELADTDGVFVGFFGERPFVVKGDASSDLVVAVAANCGAILFASELPSAYHEHFDQVIRISSSFFWNGTAALDIAALLRRQTYRKPPLIGSSAVERVTSSVPITHQQQLPKKRITLENLHTYFFPQREENASSSDEQVALPTPSVSAEPTE